MARIILTLDGGGSAGYFTACYLSFLERDLGASAGFLFDRIWGVSVGSIIGAALATGMPARDLRDRFPEFASRVFGKQTPAWKVWRPYYEMGTLRDEMRSIFGDVTMSRCRTPFAALATDITDRPVPKFWKTWDPRDADAAIVDVCCASAAAPVYFAPYEFDGKVYADGALATNKVCACALAEEIRKSQSNTLPAVLNINPAPAIKIGKPGHGQGAIGWFSRNRLVMAWFYASDAIAAYQAKAMLGVRYLQVKPAAYLGVDTLDFGAIYDAAAASYESTKLSVASLLA